MPIYNKIGTCTYCGLKDQKVREGSIERRKGMSTVLICSDELCETSFKIDPLGFMIFETELKHGTTNEHRTDN